MWGHRAACSNQGHLRHGSDECLVFRLFPAFYATVARSIIQDGYRKQIN